MPDSYVTSQATIRCSCGDKCAKLTIYPDRTVFLTSKPMANISDHVSMYNIAPFGKCHTVAYPPTGSATAANHGHLTPMPCVPGTVSEWVNGKNDYLIKEKPALLKSSYCRCKWGGVITITDDGQVDTGNPDLEKQQIETEDEWTEKEQEELLKDKEALLDGIQTALDLAGFAPGVGAIPDLLNAAIYAVRGDKLNAGLSLLAAVPVIGDAAAAAKIAGKGVKSVKTAQKTGKKIARTEKMSSEAYEAEKLRKARAKMMGIDPDAPTNSQILYDNIEPTNNSNRYLFIRSTDNAPIQSVNKVEPISSGKKGAEQYANEAKNAKGIKGKRIETKDEEIKFGEKVPTPKGVAEKLDCEF